MASHWVGALMTSTVLHVTSLLSICSAAILAAVALWVKVEERHVPPALIAWYIVIGCLIAVAYVLHNAAVKKTAVSAVPSCCRVTLVAVCIVMTIPLLLGGFHRARVDALTRDSEVAVTRSLIRGSLFAVELYSEDFGHIPTEADGFEVLLGTGGARKVYLSARSVPLDTWGTPLRYSVKHGRPVVWSLGRDRTPGTKDDIIAEGGENQYKTVGPTTK